MRVFWMCLVYLAAWIPVGGLMATGNVKFNSTTVLWITLSFCIVSIGAYFVDRAFP